MCCCEEDDQNQMQELRKLKKKLKLAKDLNKQNETTPMYIVQNTVNTQDNEIEEEEYSDDESLDQQEQFQAYNIGGSYQSDSYRLGLGLGMAPRATILSDDED